MFAFAVPGLASLLVRELSAITGVKIAELGFDTRADVVTFTAEPAALPEIITLSQAEDVFVEFGRTTREEGDKAPWVAARLLRPEPVERALDGLGRMTHAVRSRATYRVLVRVLQERSFVRTELRRHLGLLVAKQQPQWRFGDPSDLEVWIVEYQPGKFIGGLRASDVRMRQHNGRVEERAGALRPTVAAAMVRLAGSPGAALLDPCCGSGTILAEALAAGWADVYGADIDPDAVDLARENVREALLGDGDARDIDLPDGAMDASVSNLPFGKQFEVEGEMDAWLRDVLRELTRVTRAGGRIVLLAPEIARPLVPPALRMTDRVPLRLLGTKTTIWAYDRS
jgi:23S rRNA G2445 N2-methylase RlmL